MPRGARLDAPGTLHHVMVRGIEKRKIVDDDDDRENFILTQKLVNGYGVSLAETARQLGVSTSGISQILRRG